MPPDQSRGAEDYSRSAATCQSELARRRLGTASFFRRILVLLGVWVNGVAIRIRMRPFSTSLVVQRSSQNFPQQKLRTTPDFPPPGLPPLVVEPSARQRNFPPCNSASRTAYFTGRFFTSIAIQPNFFCSSGLIQVSKTLTSQRPVGGCCTAAVDWEGWALFAKWRNLNGR